MTIPFLSYFKKDKGEKAAVKVAVKERAAAPAKPALPPLEKPSSERFSKTVMPNATRTVAPQDPFQMAANSTAFGGSMATATAVAPAPPAPRTISFAAPSVVAKPRGLPPAVALALEPKVERVISLALEDVVAQMPADLVKPIETIDGTRRILLKASEVERGMASGKPTVSLATIYQQVPEIFLGTTAPPETVQVQLPFKKVLEQFTSLQVRGDQEMHQPVPQVETPFLKVTLEDGSRFGTKIDPLEMQTGDLPTVRVEPPTAQAFAAAEPEAASQAPTIGTNGNGSAPRPSFEKPTQTPTRIPFKLSPNGTDVPAPESVPASSGPSVPNLLPSPPAPARIPFKMSPPTEEKRPKPEPWLTAESFAPKAPANAPRPNVEVKPPVPSAEVKIALALKPILQGLPPFQLNGDPASVPVEARLELPFALIEPQLAAGKIAVTPKVFEAGMPPEYRGLFKAGEAADVLLPLQEVLKNLPAASLRMRDDQEEQEAGSNFATPFSAKAEEDAKRCNVAGTPIAKSVVAAPAPEVVSVAVGEVVEAPAPVAEVAAAAAPVAPAVSPEEKASDRPLRTPLQVALDTDEKLDAKAVVAHLNKISGVKACEIMFADGLSLAGSLPAELETDGLCAMAPSLMQRIENHIVETKLGALRGMTLNCLKGAVTFFMHENLCLAALHSGGDLTTEVREKLSRVVHELSRKYSNPV
jgi:predicted regulator of Ras-like GTPase activity (Roadblock/LC7/MglB family)